jgi:hypothetical protein
MNTQANSINLPQIWHGPFFEEDTIIRQDPGDPQNISKDEKDEMRFRAWLTGRNEDYEEYEDKAKSEKIFNHVVNNCLRCGGSYIAVKGEDIEELNTCVSCTVDIMTINSAIPRMCAISFRDMIKDEKKYHELKRLNTLITNSINAMDERKVIITKHKARKNHNKK